MEQFSAACGAERSNELTHAIDAKSQSNKLEEQSLAEHTLSIKKTPHVRGFFTTTLGIKA